ncbi:hypothetical protein H4W30_000009 [Amycolatopsis roodepoortensis]|uniref:Uncharacterized protein n=1 Tax=Amycolatopsis roodepoortensis TaxID=700274 RepID=A0ABR9KX88_9PSEU|nr:hypothetical protein [Amycolatopsis roodepoortensis]
MTGTTSRDRRRSARSVPTRIARHTLDSATPRIHAA